MTLSKVIIMISYFIRDVLTNLWIKCWCVTPQLLKPADRYAFTQTLLLTYWDMKVLNLTKTSLLNLTFKELSSSLIKGLKHITIIKFRTRSPYLFYCKFWMNLNFRVHARMTEFITSQSMISVQHRQLSI
jgi:hypothetical protein